MTIGSNILEDNNPIFKQPYRPNEVEKALVEAWTTKFLNVGLVEFLRVNMPQQQWC
jgi:hypothetical protein